MDTIQKERILALAQHLETLPRHQFNMERWIGHAADDTIVESWETASCDTIGCIAGHAVLLFADRGTPDNPAKFPADIAAEAQRLLGLNEKQAFHAFTPTHGSDIRADIHCDYRDVTPSDAAEMLRGLAATGTAHWRCESDPDGCDF